ncbi:hypothetical protein F4781DRAFT_438336 [Annulohypoxylon bovei var. microspora]|nr:hypothetical protein F4781DRAFT_438336 [Annulohypoxylon bovei var. microspora]
MDSELWNSLTPEEREAYLDGPALEPPSGVQPNFINPPNHDGVMIGVVTMCLILATIVVFIRTYSKLFVEKKFRLEDGLALVAFGPYVGSCWCIFHVVSLGGSFVHQWNVTARDFQSVVYDVFLGYEFYCFAVMFSKTAILFEWLRVFVPRGMRNLFFWTCWLVLISNIIFYIAAIFFQNLACKPVKKAWIPMTPGTCLDIRAVEFSSPCINLVFDLIILFLPQRTIWSLNMSLKRRLGVSLVFSMGIFACAAGVGRVVTKNILIHSVDKTYWSAPEALCGLAEMTCLFLIFCISAVPKAFAQPGLIMEVARSLRSWSRLKLQDGLARGSHQARRRVTHDGRYHMMDEFQMPIVDLVTIGDTRIAPSAPENVRYGDGQSNPDGILRTITLMTQDDRVSEISNDQQVIRQHPWMDTAN